MKYIGLKEKNNEKYIYSFAIKNYYGKVYKKEFEEINLGEDESVFGNNNSQEDRNINQTDISAPN